MTITGNCLFLTKMDLDARWGSDLFASLWFLNPGRESNCQGQFLLRWTFSSHEPTRSKQPYPP